MLPLARLEGEPKSGAIFAYLFISATLARNQIERFFTRTAPIYFKFPPGAGL